ncbi:hypothetical protein DPMN_166423 [Dreissena polymorpha]|uniref:Uncharacterized protein n=1 Tax=Dreissena polymorpha TaxID=45954 RepID=A0A9D4IXK7_DREPO|nr:hypothetical protein DPMN_166423 [Dreissena polymorpha]
MVVILLLIITLRSYSTSKSYKKSSAEREQSGDLFPNVHHGTVVFGNVSSDSLRRL